MTRSNAFLAVGMISTVLLCGCGSSTPTESPGYRLSATVALSTGQHNILESNFSLDGHVIYTHRSQSAEYFIAFSFTDRPITAGPHTITVGIQDQLANPCDCSLTGGIGFGASPTSITTENINIAAAVPTGGSISYQFVVQ